MTSLVLIPHLTILFALLGGGIDDQQQVRSAIVQVGGCSGVCVDPSGLIMTAKHCDLGEVETVTMDGQEFVALRIYQAPGTEGPVVYDCIGSGFSWVPVAQSKPEPGEQVLSMGFPAINGSREFREVRGEVERGAQVWYDGEPFLGNIVDMVVTEGWSGGPLLNSRGEVVGLANSSRPGVGTVFISHASTREAFHAAQTLHRSRPLLQILLLPEDRQSAAFLLDFRSDLDFQRELREHFRIVFLDARQRHPSYDHMASTSPLPAFILPDGQFIAGYQSQLDLLQRLFQMSQVDEESQLQEW